MLNRARAALWNYSCDVICSSNLSFFMSKLKAFWYFSSGNSWEKVLTVLFYPVVALQRLVSTHRIPHWNQGTQLSPLTPSILSVHVWYHTALFWIHSIFKTTLSQCVSMYDAHPLLQHRFTGQRLLRRRVTTASLGKGEKIWEEKKEKTLGHEL